VIACTLGFLASGRSSNMQAIIDACRGGQLDCRPAVVISNNPDSGALERARKAGIPGYHLSRNTHPAPEDLDRTIMATLRRHGVDLVVLAGYMKKVGPEVLEAYRHRIVNIHPALLPKFGGVGMYGMKVHEAVIAAGERETGVTVHLVNDEYDTGSVLAQRAVPVAPDDTAESLATRVIEVEHVLYVETLQKIVSGDIVLPPIGADF